MLWRVVLGLPYRVYKGARVRTLREIMTSGRYEFRILEAFQCLAFFGNGILKWYQELLPENFPDRLLSKV
jgi:hypothetical protein